MTQKVVSYSQNIKLCQEICGRADTLGYEVRSNVRLTLVQVNEMLKKLQSGNKSKLDFKQVTNDFSTVNKIGDLDCSKIEANVAIGIHSGRNTNPNFPKRRLISTLEKSSSKYSGEKTMGKRKRHECSFCHVPTCASIATCSVLTSKGYFRIKSHELDHFISFYFIAGNAQYDMKVVSSCADRNGKLIIFESIPKNMVWLVIHGLYVINSQIEAVENNICVMVTCYGSTGSIMSRLDEGNEEYDKVMFKMNTIRNIIFKYGSQNKVLVSFNWKKQPTSICEIIDNNHNDNSCTNGSPILHVEV